MLNVQLTDKHVLRERARQHVDQGAVTEGYQADREEVLRLLNESLATELVCTLRYKRHYFMANGLKASIAADEFLEHATQEAEHADRLAERIVQLGGEPEFNPDLLSKMSHAEYKAGNTLKEMVYEDLVAERIAIDTYREIIQYIGDHDPTTRRIFEDILAQEEEHADDMADIYEELACPGLPATLESQGTLPWLFRACLLKRP
ncbi:bacterioferritin [Pseudomonas sp. CA3A]|uniref:Bacterioferritin n=2 Tax=Pseudomonas typographi TaxID=2715964 RepID=A0ABR7ZA36_9PSED|nr:ferritin-like domain-containing protein [Pseudomonas typographi]MBD1602153.1 bacterioferritin [Pseudomonas typographi]